MPNNRKYGRLYPDRAVAPARAALIKCQQWFGMAGNPAITSSIKEGLDALDERSFPPDEPIFVLRGQDTLAPDVVRNYADQIVLMEGAFGDPGQAASVIEHIRDFADEMERWQPRKLPD